MNIDDYVYPFYFQSLLNEARMEGISCDITLVAEDTEMKAHKSILAAASPYFRSMFFSKAEFKESKQEKVIIHDVDKDSLATILEFIYTSHIKITEDNVFQLMGSSDLFQIYSLKMWISYYLQTKITTANCLGLYVKSTFYDYYDLSQIVLRFIYENFIQITEEEEFLELPGKVLIKIISSRFLNVPDENALIKSIMTWITVDAENRIEFAIDLLRQIELMNISIPKLIELKNEPIFCQSYPSKIQDFLSRQIMAWYKLFHGRAESFLQWETVRYGAEQGVILAIGGESDGVISKNCECFTLGYESWKCVIPRFIHTTNGPQALAAIPPMKVARRNAAVAYDFYNAYIIGGRDDTYLSSCESFNIKKVTWTEFEDIPEALEGGSAVVFRGRLIYIGGRNETGPTNAAWEWDDIRKTWKKFPALKYPRSFHCAVALGGYIYVLGGFECDLESALKSGERFDPSVNKWFEIRGMQKARAKFGCAAIEKCIYVMGGLDRSCGITSVERYNIDSNEWTYMSPMLVPRHSFSVAVYDKKIFCIGGSDSIHILHSVDKFNPSNNRWHFLLSMQLARCGLAAATLLVPFIASDVHMPIESPMPGAKHWE